MAHAGRVVTRAGRVSTMRRQAAGTVLLCAFAAGCQTDATCTPDQSIVTAQRAWRAHHHEKYRFVWQQTCFCSPDATQPIIVTVRHDTIVSATDRGGVAVPDNVRANLKTIDALYRHVDSAQCKSATVRITASDTGVPENVYIDPNAGVADDEFSVAISELVALP